MHLLEARSIFEAIIQFDEDSRAFTLEAAMGSLDKRSQQMLGELSFAELGLAAESATGQALDGLRALETTAIERKRNALRQQIREMEKSGNFAEAMRLTEEFDRAKRAAPGG
jgi:hypothetical protein